MPWYTTADARRDAERQAKQSGDAGVSKLGRALQPGDEALTNFDGGRLSRVRITARMEGASSQSGICFQVEGLRKSSGPDAWIDADWFEPVPEFAP